MKLFTSSAGFRTYNLILLTSIIWAPLPQTHHLWNLAYYWAIRYSSRIAFLLYGAYMGRPLISTTHLIIFSLLILPSALIPHNQKILLFFFLHVKCCKISSGLWVVFWKLWEGLDHPCPPNNESVGWEMKTIFSRAERNKCTLIVKSKTMIIWWFWFFFSL